MNSILPHAAEAQTGLTIVQVADINPGTADGFPGGRTGGAFCVYNDALYFHADDGSSGSELFRYDGASIELVADLNPGTDLLGRAQDSNPRGFTVFNGELLFRADDGIHGRELFKYDGQRISLLSDINPLVTESGSARGSYPTAFTPLRDMLLFKADDGSHRMEIFVYTGSEVLLLADLFPGRKGSRARDFTVFRNNVLFSAANGFSGRQLFSFDGSKIAYLTDTVPSESTYELPHLSEPNFTVFDHNLYFRARDEDHGTELFAYTGAEIRLMADINPGLDDAGQPGNSDPTDFAVYKDALYFSADDGTHGQELHSFDGQVGTLVKDIWPTFQANEKGHSYPSALTVFGDLLVFSADDGIHGEELFTFDGDEIRLIQDIFTGTDRFGRPNGSSPRGFAEIGDYLVFTAEDSDAGGKVYMFDGATVQLVSGTGNSQTSPGHIVSSYRFVPFKNSLYFSAEDAQHGQELWQITMN
ncbi:MAG: hypothetical protein HOH43_18040 [Candidatus Latescibacteria bacterium]|nr:hypothetical protein [Candidatus Latescibacterota bacterium]